MGLVFVVGAVMGGVFELLMDASTAFPKEKQCCNTFMCSGNTKPHQKQLELPVNEMSPAKTAVYNNCKSFE